MPEALSSYIIGEQQENICYLYEEIAGFPVIGRGFWHGYVSNFSGVRLIAGTAIMPRSRSLSLDAPYLAQAQSLPSELVFIMGCHRSGTSLLYHLLAYTGQVNYISAYDIIKYDELLHNRLTGTEAAVKAKLQGILQEEATRGLDDLPVGADLPEEYRFLMHREKKRTFIFNFRRRLEQLFFAPHLTAQTLPDFLEMCQKKRFLAGDDRPLILKNPSDHYFNFRTIHEMLPHAKFIFIHRHPLHMFNSYLHSFPAMFTARSNYAALIDPQYDTLFGRFPLRRHLSLRVLRSDTMCRLLLNRLIESFEYYLSNIRQLPPEQYVSLRYEDLCDDPAGCLIRIGTDLRLDLEPRIPPRFVVPRHLPILDRIRRHYAHRVAEMTPYLEHCHYPVWPSPEGPAPDKDVERTCQLTQPA